MHILFCMNGNNPSVHFTVDADNLIENQFLQARGLNGMGNFEGQTLAYEISVLYEQRYLQLRNSFAQMVHFPENLEALRNEIEDIGSIEFDVDILNNNIQQPANQGALTSPAGSDNEEEEEEPSCWNSCGKR